MESASLQSRQPGLEQESRSLVYTLDNNLFVTTADGKTQQVTDEPKGIVCGQSVHRQEFGISKVLSGVRRKSACFLPHGRKHGNRLSTSKYLHPHSDTGAGQVSDGRNDQPQSDCRHLQSGTEKTVYLKAGTHRPLFQYQLGP